MIPVVSDSTEHRRIRIVGMAAIGYGLVIASTALQAYTGRSPSDLGIMTTALALVGLALMTISAVLALRGLAHRPQPPATSPPGPMVAPA